MPIGVFLPVCVAVVWQRVNERRSRRQRPPLERLKPVRWAVICVMAVNLLFGLTVCFKPADPYISLYQALYRTYPEPTVLLYTVGQNPYVRVCEVNFYKRSSLEVRQIEHLAALATHPDYDASDSRPYLLATMDVRLADSLAKNARRDIQHAACLRALHQRQQLGGAHEGLDGNRVAVNNLLRCVKLPS